MRWGSEWPTISSSLWFRCTVLLRFIWKLNPRFFWQKQWNSCDRVRVKARLWRDCVTLAGMTCENFATFSQFWVYSSVSLLLHNNFYPVYIVPTSSKGKESDELVYTVRSLVMVRGTSCQRTALSSDFMDRYRRRLTVSRPKQGETRRSLPAG